MSVIAETVMAICADRAVNDAARIIEKLFSVDKQWNEGQHRRDQKGRFTGNGGSGSHEEQNVKSRNREPKTRSVTQNKNGQKAARVKLPVDVTEEYRKTAKPGKGRVIEAPGYRMDDSPKGKLERENAEWLVNTFGGNVTMNRQTSQKGEIGKKNPEYIWRDKLWEMKEPEVPTINSMKNNLHDALRQIKDNPGGVLMDITKCGASFEIAEAGILARARQSAHFPLDVIILKRGEDYKVLRFDLE